MYLESQKTFKFLKVTFLLFQKYLNITIHSPFQTIKHLRMENMERRGRKSHFWWQGGRIPCHQGWGFYECGSIRFWMFWKHGWLQEILYWTTLNLVQPTSNWARSHGKWSIILGILHRVGGFGFYSDEMEEISIILELITCQIHLIFFL